jgi:hypothetical protein
MFPEFVVGLIVGEVKEAVITVSYDLTLKILMRCRGVQAHAGFKHFFCNDVTTTRQAEESRRSLRNRAARKRVSHLPIEVCILVLRGNSTRVARRRARRTVRRSHSAGCF